MAALVTTPLIHTRCTPRLLLPPCSRQSSFLSLFRLKVVLFAEELASLVTTPLVLACSLPACAGGLEQERSREGHNGILSRRRSKAHEGSCCANLDRRGSPQRAA